MTPPVAIGVMLLFLFNGRRSGSSTGGSTPIGIQGPYWTTDPTWIKPSIAIMDIWACGGTMVILLAALYGVPQQLYEAASMDGALGWRRFKDITLPMISPALFFCFIILTLAGLNAVHAGVHGVLRRRQAREPEAALFYSIYLFRNAFEYFNMGFASAMAWLLFAISMIVTLHQHPRQPAVRLLPGGAAMTRRQPGERTASRPPAGRRAVPDGVTPAQAALAAARDRAGSRRALFVVLLIGLSILFLYPFVWLASAVVQAAGRHVRQQADPAPTGRGTSPATN